MNYVPCEYELWFCAGPLLIHVKKISRVISEAKTAWLGAFFRLNWKVLSVPHDMFNEKWVRTYTSEKLQRNRKIESIKLFIPGLWQINVHLQHFKGNSQVNSNLGALGQANFWDLSSKQICIPILSGALLKNSKKYQGLLEMSKQLGWGNFQVNFEGFIWSKYMTKWNICYTWTSGKPHKNGKMDNFKLFILVLWQINVYLQYFKGNFKVNSNLGDLGQVNIRDLSSKLICILILSGPWFRNGKKISGIIRIAKATWLGALFRLILYLYNRYML